MSKLLNFVHERVGEVDEYLVREAALADGYTRGRSDALDELFFRFLRTGEALS